MARVAVVAWAVGCARRRRRGPDARASPSRWRRRLVGHVSSLGLALFSAPVSAITYLCSTLYYSLAVGHAAVEAGGGFEALIGVGYMLGPCCCVAFDAPGSVAVGTGEVQRPRWRSGLGRRVWPGALCASGRTRGAARPSFVSAGSRDRVRAVARFFSVSAVLAAARKGASGGRTFVAAFAGNCCLRSSAGYSTRRRTSADSAARASDAARELNVDLALR